MGSSVEEGSYTSVTYIKHIDFFSKLIHFVHYEIYVVEFSYFLYDKENRQLYF